jgi:hypothetical protein
MTIDPRWSRIAPGVYDDGAGGMHLEVTELLEAHGFEDTPENRRTLEHELQAVADAYRIPTEERP